MKTIGFIGMGNMGSALAQAVCAHIEPSQVCACDHHEDRLQHWVDTLGCAAVAQAADVAAQCTYVVIGIKPNGIDALLAELCPTLRQAQEAGSAPVLVSLAAGYPLAAYRRMLDDQGCSQVPVVRLMPNSGVRIGAGVCLFAPDELVDDEALAHLMTLFAEAGLCEAVDEDALAAAIPVFSCSPAYVYMFIEALADAGTQLGLEHEFAARLAAQAVAGSARLALQSDQNLAALREGISTPGGMTIAATNEMERLGFRAAVIGGALKAFDHSQHMH